MRLRVVVLLPNPQIEYLLRWTVFLHENQTNYNNWWSTVIQVIGIPQYLTMQLVQLYRATWTKIMKFSEKLDFDAQCHRFFNDRRQILSITAKWHTRHVGFTRANFQKICGHWSPKLCAEIMRENKNTREIYAPFLRNFSVLRANICGDLNVWLRLFVDQTEFSSILSHLATIKYLRTSWSITRQIFCVTRDIFCHKKI
jgi:hypothetical protein